MSIAKIAWELIPRSQAHNSYELLQEVKAAVLAEPRRVIMEEWLCKTPVMIHNTETGKDEETRLPACGTVGCIAGWMTLLKASRFERTDENYNDLRIHASDRALDFLPSSVYLQARRLFWGTIEDPSSLYPFPPKELYGTDEYVTHVAANIDRFCRAHEAELRAHALTPAR